MQLIPVGSVGGFPILYYPEVAEEVFVGLITFPGGKVSPAKEANHPVIHIVYPTTALPIVISVIELMEKQGRSPQVCFVSVGEDLEVEVLFRALVSTEMLESFSDIRGRSVDLSQVEGEHKVELLVTAETKLPLSEGEKLLPLFEDKFKVVVGVTGSMEIPSLWEGEVSSYDKEKPSFLPRD